MSKHPYHVSDIFFVFSINRITMLCLAMVMMAAGSVLIAGCASTGSLAAAQADLPSDRVDARGLFLENCATCHDEDGRAGNLHGLMVGAQNLRDADWQATTPDKQIIDTIENGSGAMPAFGKRLSASEITAMVAYVRSLKTGS